MKRIVGNLAVIIMASISFGQTRFISVEDLLGATSATSLLKEQTNYDFDGNVYADITNGRLLCVASGGDRADPNTLSACNPKSIYLFELNQLIANFSSELKYEAPIALLAHPDRIVTNWADQNKVGINIYEKGGQLANSLLGFDWITISPSGKFFFQTNSSAAEYPLYIFDENAEKIFQIPTAIELVYQAAWLSDSMLIVGSGNILTLWDIIGQKMIWETNVPSDYQGINEDYKIIVSQKAGIILFFDTFAGCYCFNSDGNFIWQKPGAGGISRVHGAGVRDEDGQVVIISAEPAAIDVDLIGRDGKIIAQAKKDCVPGTGYRSIWDQVVEYKGDYVFFRYVSYKNNSPSQTQKSFFTSMVMHIQNRELVISFLDGLWFFINNDNSSQAILGIDNANPSLVKSFLIKKGD